MGHPNLSDEINANIEKSEYLGGVFVKDMPTSSTLHVQTKNTLYVILKNNADEIFIQGGKYAPLPTPVTVHGSTWGGSMLKVGFVGIGMHLEFSILGAGDQRKTVTTSEIQSVERI